MSRLEFVFDIASADAFLAWLSLEQLERRLGIEAELCPVPLSAMDAPTTDSAPKRSYLLEDRARRAEALGVRLAEGQCDEGAVALLLACPPERRRALTSELFRRVWLEGQDLRGAHPLEALAKSHGFEARPVDVAAAAQAARRRGVFGVPSFFADDELFFGADRADAVERRLGGQPPQPSWTPPPAPIELWFDFSSPYAYLGVKEALRVVGADGLELKPMLLGAIFQKLEGPLVPLFEFSDEKRAYMSKDLDRQAEEAQVKFRFPSRFPMNTVKALRMVIAAEADPRLVERLFDAYWNEDQDIDDPAVLERLAGEVGLDGAALLAATREDAVKKALFAANEAALARGLFGAPTFVVVQGDEARRFWGRDRLVSALCAS